MDPRRAGYNGDDRAGMYALRCCGGRRSSLDGKITISALTNK